MPQPIPINTQGSLRVQSGANFRRGEIKISQPIPIPREGGDGLGPQALNAPDQLSITALPVRHSQSSVLSASRRQTYGVTPFHNPQVSVSSYISHDSALQRRRGSTLKTVMRKLFGKKRRSQLDEGDEGNEEPSNISVDREVFVKEAGTRALVETQDSSVSNGTRSSTNRKRSTAISRLSSASSDHLLASRQGQRISIPRQTVRRRATLPSLVLSDDEAREIAQSMLSPTSTRPASEADMDRDDSRQQSHPSLHAHRRSRSADALRDLVQRHRMSPIQWRRRSDKIKSWQTSIFESDDRKPPSVRPHTSASDVPTTAITDDRETSVPEDRDVTPQTEPEGAPFDIENLIGTMSGTDIPVEQRLATLEVKLMDLEFAIARMQGTDTDGFQRATDRTPEKGKTPRERRPSHRPNFAVDSSSSVSETESESSGSFGGSARPISTATLRPNPVCYHPQPWLTASASSINLHGISIEQYSALVTLVRREQTARRTLEVQVTQLQDDLRDLRHASGLPGSSAGTHYPIPSPDSDDVRRSRRLRDDSPRRVNRITIGSESGTEANHSDSRQWGNTYYRSDIEASSRTTVPGMI